MSSTDNYITINLFLNIIILFKSWHLYCNKIMLQGLIWRSPSKRWPPLSFTNRGKRLERHVRLIAQRVWSFPIAQCCNIFVATNQLRHVCSSRWWKANVNWNSALQYKIHAQATTCYETGSSKIFPTRKRPNHYIRKKLNHRFSIHITTIVHYF